tara:strand:- start:26 stop:538 length:513 start_codon:yes stop_codon:yes gene_type:complete
MVHKSTSSSTSSFSSSSSKKKVISQAARQAARKAIAATKTLTVKETVRFGNDITEIERIVPIGQSSSSSSSLSSSSSSSSSAAAPKSALDTLTAALDGPSKVSTMQKTSMEWDTFKSKQGISDELEKYTQNGYLTKQEFLGRVDLRKFEQEKAQREKLRRHEEANKGKKR